MAPTSRKKRAGPVPVDATKHKSDTRTNIPTAELESFAEEDERKPSKLLYPRDPSLDPQIVWRGKDDQDRVDLEVPAVPVYIQETIEPRALIEDLRNQGQRERTEEQASFFEPFEDLDLAERVNFYHHEGKWANRIILGDSLLVMASLAEKEGLKGTVQMIYVDPPYGIKFGSNWQVSTRKRDVKDGKAEDTTRQPEQIHAYRDTWELGIHSYLGYLRDRLSVARDLLTESGSIFVQIGDENVHLVRSLLDEVMGSENMVSQIAVKKTAGATGELLAGTTDYLLWYAKNKSVVKYRPLYREREIGGLGAGAYSLIEEAEGSRRRATTDELRYPATAPPGSRFYRLQILTSQAIGRAKGEGAASWFPVRIGEREFRPSMQSRWKTNEAGMQRLILAHRVEVIGNTINYVRYHDDFPAFPLTNLWDDTQSGSGMEKVYVVQTSTKVVERCVLMSTDPGDLVLDPTCGSGTTAFVSEQWGRRWITLDTSRVALALARTRLMSARYPYYLLADSPKGTRKTAELTGFLEEGPFQGDIRKGFVYKRVPHVTLKSIAKNPGINEEKTRSDIESAIKKHADIEILYDRPYPDPKIVRVSGPFTVESLSPHRVLSQEADPLAADVPKDTDASQFVDHILDNLRQAGVQNTVKNERLTFERLEPWPGGVYIQASGDYIESGDSRTAAICIGPEHGTVGTELVREAAKEAARFADLLVVCGFAFEALLGEESMQIGRLTILKAKMNPDLQMPDLLKKTGAGNLFVAFGEPDLEIKADEKSMMTIEIKGVDVYDPTTGVVRSHSTEDIACWFIDTEYNGESFFVRHAYFLGADNPYDKLKRALRTDIDDEAWASLYSAVSRPFPKPLTGRIAVKVINHYGDEVLRVYDA